MIIGKNFYITEMPKTGTTFLRNYFKQYKKDIRLSAHHDTIDENPDLNFLTKEFRIGTIRNPYSWYLSFWKWSCQQKKRSPLYSDITSRRLKIKRLKLSSNLISYILFQLTKNKKNLKKLFEDINSKKNFNLFVEILLNFKYKNVVSSDFSFVPHKDLGYMTYYFLIQNISIKDYKILYNSNKKFSSILKFLDKKLNLNYFFKTENLISDLKIFLKKNKFLLKNIKKIEKNSTKNKFDNNYFTFFTKKNLKLIEKKDAYLFKKFKYKKISNKIRPQS